MDATSKVRGILEGEAGGEEGGLVEEVDEILDGWVLGVLIQTLLQGLDDGVEGVDLHGLLGRHVTGHGGVAQSLGLHDALHVGGPAELAGDEDAGRADDARADDDLLDLLAEDVLEGLAEGLVGGLQLLLACLFSSSVSSSSKPSLVTDTSFLPSNSLQLLHGVLIDGVDQEQDLEVLLLQSLQEGRVGDGALDSPVM